MPLPRLAALSLLALAALTPPLHATTPSRVYTFSHSFSIMVAMAPEALTGVPGKFTLSPQRRAYLPPNLRELPPLPQPDRLDLEAVKLAGFDLALGWDTPGFRRDQVPQLTRIGLPVLLVGVDRLDQYPATFRTVGQKLGKADRGAALAGYLEQAGQRLAKAVATVPMVQRRRVYYAESLDGLSSQCGHADRAEVIWLAGAINALPCSAVDGYQAKPSDLESNNVVPGLETLLRLDPDVIITRFPATASQLRQDHRWQALRAVREGQIYAIPDQPFNWFDRPPSYMRIMGAQWLANLLYPTHYPVDMHAESRRFFSLFFDVALNDAQLATLLAPGGKA